MDGSQFTAFAARLKAFIDHLESDDAEFNRFALELFGLQFEHVPIYQELCLSRGIRPRAIKCWNEIPALPTESFKEFAATSLAPEERTAVFYSSGTTKEDRSRHFHSAESLTIYEDSLKPWFRRHFMPDQTKMSLLILTPSRDGAPNSSLTYMFDTVARSLPWERVETVGQIMSDSAWEVDADRAWNFLRGSQKPVALLGTAFSYVHLLDAAADKPLALPVGSRALETGGYKGRSRSMPKAELHRLISRRLGIGLNYVVSEYGMSELSSQAYDRITGKSGGSFHFPPWARAEIISPETGRPVAEGESGLVRLFDLANVRSVMAVQTADLAIKRGEGFELLGRAEAVAMRGCSLMTV